MPSIEVLCVGQQGPTGFDDLPFAIVADTERRSHRPHSLFQADFAVNLGVLYHLGNPDLKVDSEGRCFFAYQLLSPASQESGTFLEFAPAFRSGVHAMLAELVRQSPEQQLLFTSDWQFGPEETVRGGTTDLAGLWQLHDSHQLLLNAHYLVVAVRGSPGGR